MIRAILCMLCIGLFPLGVMADAPVAHATASDQTGQGPTNAAAMDQRFEDVAREYAGRDVPRVALSDITYPIDPAEFAAMDGYGAIWIAVVSQEKDELPLKRVYAMVGGKQVELRLAASHFAKSSGNALVQKTLGPYRWDGLYYYPSYLSAEAQQLLVDFAKNRSGFVMLNMVEEPEPLPDYLKAPIAHPKAGTPPADAAAKLVAREYPGLFTMPAPR